MVVHSLSFVYYSSIVLIVCLFHQQIITVSSTNNQSEPTSKRFAIVSLLLTDALRQSVYNYKSMREVFLHSLRATGYKDDILFLVAGKDPPDEDENIKLAKYNVKIKNVRQIHHTTSVRKDFQGVMTKLQLWSLTEYHQIVFYDNDFIFHQNPVIVLDTCGTAQFCAVHDFTSPPTYFNSGFMVITPNLTTFNDLIAHRAWGNNNKFPDQHMLNTYFEGKWKALPEIYNCQRLCNGKFPSAPKMNETIAVHMRGNLKGVMYGVVAAQAVLARQHKS